MRHSRGRSLVSALVAAAIAATPVLAPTMASAAPDSGARTAPQSQRQQAFSDAARAYGVPEAVLLAVSYLESRWDANAGQPSRGAGYGPMHLTDIDSVSEDPHHDHGDARGDESRPMRPDADADAEPPASLRTVALAEKLTGVSAAELRADAAKNIRGGAAVLNYYQSELGLSSADPAQWYGAVARYSGASDTKAARQFADEVYATMQDGVSRVTDDGQRVALPATSVSPNRGQVGALGLRATESSNVECPDELACEWIPAPYEQYGPNPWDYGNHDLADRPNNLKIDYIVIHDTETSYENTLRLVQNPRYVSWQYTLRSHDGHIAQHVKHKDVAWQAGNWYVNTHSIGLEHEGFAAQGTWYTEAMYRTSAKLVRYLAAKYDIPIDRAHIIGHDNVPAITPARVPAMHWDPGPYWDWAHYFALLGKPFTQTGTPRSKMVTINPDYATNQPAFFGCDSSAPSAPCPARGSTSVILRSEPRDDASLLNDPGLRPDGSPNTMRVSDIGSRVDTGTQYAVAEDRGEWIAIWYLGQKGWLHKSDTVWTTGLVVTPKQGKDNIPVYGRAYPEAEAYPSHIPVQAIVPLQYTISAGERYTVGHFPKTNYYRAVTFDPTPHTVVSGKDRYYQIQLGHRFMYVRAADVDLAASPA
ncbi:MAG: N-acetylmuramoyl-L-alanine amidase [Micromonosporaceae bacterium]|nr:N-acetylmuramoyl-L-alanine amidase [Micromonosporaceae bacterium]